MEDLLRMEDSLGMWVDSRPIPQFLGILGGFSRINEIKKRKGHPISMVCFPWGMGGISGESDGGQRVN